MQRSITQPELPDGAAEPDAIGGSDWSSLTKMLRPAHWGLILVFACLLIFANSQQNKANTYLHFVFQAQSWMDGNTSIPTHVEGTATSPGDNYQDIMPILDASGNDTNRGIIPFPPLPAWVLLPFVAIWHLGTNQQLIATVFGAIDVGTNSIHLVVVEIDTAFDTSRDETTIAPSFSPGSAAKVATASPPPQRVWMVLSSARRNGLVSSSRRRLNGTVGCWCSRFSVISDA